MELAENVVVAGKFRLIRMIGRGGMGSVWEATHLALDIPCAVKFIEGDFANVPEMQARFQREAKAAAALRSPNVVQILDHDIWEGMPYIAMELLDGEELSKRIARVGALSPAETNVVLGQVCRALGKAHAQGIIHRDLKPDNLFLVRDEDREIVKILDFGIAKSKNPNLDIGGNTKTGAMLGTPYYMSPEQAQGNKSIDGRADLWALGVIAYECVTGQRPFESDALGDLLMQIMVKPLPMPSQLRPGLPQAFDAWFAKACARDPKDRFQSAKELSEALAAAAGQATTTDIMASHEKLAVMKGTLPLNTPNPYGGVSTPNPYAGASTPNPYAGASTPNPYAGVSTPNPMGPPPGMAPGPGAPTPFAAAASVAIVPKKSMTGAIVGAAAGVLVLVGVVVIALVVKGHSASHEAGPASTETATATATATETATATAPATTTAASAAPTPSETASAAPTETAAAPATHAHAGGGTHHAHAGAAGHAGANAHAGTAAHPPAGGGGNKTDLGF
jgi:serine/threonine protein kinase